MSLDRKKNARRSAFLTLRLAALLRFYYTRVLLRKFIILRLVEAEELAAAAD